MLHGLSVLILFLSVFTSGIYAWYKPAVDATWAIQYEGNPIDTTLNVDVYDLDGFNSAKTLIDKLHGEGRRVICYFSAGSYEKYAPDAQSFPSSVLGNVLDGWPDEKWLDVRQISVLKPIMMARAQLARTKGCDGIDWDNVDGYTNDSGFAAKAADQIAYNTMLAKITHDLDMAVGLKNDLDQVSQLVSSFDFAVNEQCQDYQECSTLMPFIRAGKPVWAIDYGGIAKTTRCTLLNSLGFRALLKKMSLDATGFACWSLLKPSVQASARITTTKTTIARQDVTTSRPTTLATRTTSIQKLTPPITTSVMLSTSKTSWNLTLMSSGITLSSSSVRSMTKVATTTITPGRFQARTTVLTRTTPYPTKA